jgi:hypothetical protein
VLRRRQLWWIQASRSCLKVVPTREHVREAPGRCNQQDAASTPAVRSATAGFRRPYTPTPKHEAPLTMPMMARKMRWLMTMYTLLWTLNPEH